ncbi:MAG: transposase [Bermanella sp.]
MLRITTALYNLLNNQLLTSEYNHMDETPVQVLKEPDKSPESKSYMWVRKTGDPRFYLITQAVVEQMWRKLCCLTFRIICKRMIMWDTIK